MTRETIRDFVPWEDVYEKVHTQGKESTKKPKLTELKKSIVYKKKIKNVITK